MNKSITVKHVLIFVILIVVAWYILSIVSQNRKPPGIPGPNDPKTPEGVVTGGKINI